MFDKVRAIKTLSVTIIAKERFKDKYVTQKAYIKKQMDPVCIYYKQLFPETGAEVLINATYNKKALVNPNAFPWTNLNLDPYGSILRDTQHHTIYQSGFDYLVDILSFLTEKYKDHLKEMIFSKGSIEYHDQTCYKIEFTNPHFKISPYPVTENTTPEALGRKLKICDYTILERYTTYNDFQDNIKKGITLYLPNDYAKRLVILISTKTYLPVYMEIYDEKGLFEQYQFSDVKINQRFSDMDFSDKNKEYGFK